MENEKMINAVRIEKKQFREDACDIAKSFMDNGKEAGKVEGGLAMSGLIFIDRVQNSLFGGNDVAMFTEEAFDNAVEAAVASLSEEAKKGGKSTMAGMLISISGAMIAAPLCRKYFPKEGESNG